MEQYSTHARDFEYHIPMKFYNASTLDNKEVMGRRFSLVLIEKGSGMCQIDGKNHYYMAPCLICVNEQEHAVIPASEQLVMKVLFFHPNGINSGMDFEILRKQPEGCPITLIQDIYSLRFFIERKEGFFGKIAVGPTTAKRIAMLMSSFDSETEAQNRDNWPCRSRSLLMEMLFILDHVSMEENPLDDPTLESIDDKLGPILVYIYNHYEEKISIEQLTNMFHLNRTTLSKMFQEQLGESFVTFLNKLRITIAAQLLRDTMLPIAEIMDKVGFHDNAHFLRSFKKETSYSPSDYRKNFNWM